MKSSELLELKANPPIYYPHPKDIEFVVYAYYNSKIKKVLYVGSSSLGLQRVYQPSPKFSPRYMAIKESDKLWIWEAESKVEMQILEAKFMVEYWPKYNLQQLTRWKTINRVEVDLSPVNPT